ncbi:protein of unknown function [Anaerovirgula multivorans]|uniref:DUF1858 domain-containing protein n=1 Tax=Anaerovirgula multivorans TaxID=312168 RepID=A0A239CYV4_9FIRM|nr:DUF1858 domain-containing protein [Anaerovirgula multivorans]SNS25405.1 protein of unknown function [Anaerovirgula multivorans]
MAKIVDLNKTIYELHKSNPDIIEIMKKIGFEDVAKPGMINTAGRFMTISKGAKMKGVDINKIKEVFIEHGYQIIE